MNNTHEEDRDAVDRLTEAWGDLGPIFGIPRTTARIQGLLLATAGPVSLDEIVERLGVSKGGASMRLKELREWGVVRRVRESGDRRDFHEAADDVWGSFLALARARKRSEFDPVADRIRASIAELRDRAGKKHATRLGKAGEVLDTLDGLGERLIESGPTLRAVLRFLGRKR